MKLFLALSGIFILNFQDIHAASAAELTAMQKCQSYFIQADILQSLTALELVSLKKAATTFARLQLRPHEDVRNQKAELNSQVLQLAKQKEFTREQLAQFLVLFRDFISNTDLSDASQTKQALQQNISNVHTLHSQRQHFDLLRKYLSIEEMQTSDSALNLALLRSVERNSYNSYKIEIEDIRLLLEMGADKDTSNDQGRTALRIAFEQRRLPVVEFLVKAGAKIDASSLAIASHVGKEKMLIFLLKSGAQIDIADAKGETALMKAAVDLNSKCVRLLLKFGANPNLTDLTNNTALILASSAHPSSDVQKRSQIQIVQMLLEAKVETRAIGANGQTALLFAIHRGQEKIIELLLKAGALADLKQRHITEEEIKAVEYVATIGWSHILQMLIEAGVDKNLRLNQDETFLTLATLLSRKNLIQYLLSINVDVNAKTRHGTTALHLASIVGNTEIVQMLLEAGADPHLKNDNSKTPLSLAKKHKRKEVVALLNAYMKKTSFLQKVKDLLSKWRRP